MGQEQRRKEKKAKQAEKMNERDAKENEKADQNERGGIEQGAGESGTPTKRRWGFRRAGLGEQRPTYV
jgi:hypothetical protein